MKYPLSERTIINKTEPLVITPTISTSAYADGDVVGGLLDLSDLCGFGGGGDVSGGVIRQVLLVDDGAKSAVFDLWLFDGAPTTIADNDAFAGSITAADLVKRVGTVALSSYTTVNGNTYAEQTGLDYAHGTGQLYAYLVLNGSTPTYTAATDLTLKVTGWKD